MLGKHFACICRHEAEAQIRKDVTLMQRPRMTRVISFRITEKEWLDIQRAAASSGENPNDWCRTITLETLRIPEGLTPNQRLLFSQISHTQYLVWVGFQLLADDKLESEQWKYYREHARTHIEAIVNDALKNLRSMAVK
jgi:hypothetical protein